MEKVDLAGFAVQQAFRKITDGNESEADTWGWRNNGLNLHPVDRYTAIGHFILGVQHHVRSPLHRVGKTKYGRQDADFWIGGRRFVAYDDRTTQQKPFEPE